MAFNRTPTGGPSASSDLGSPSDFGAPPVPDTPSPDEYGGGDDVTLTLPRDVASALLDSLQQAMSDGDQSQDTDGDDNYKDSPLSAGPTSGRGGYGS